jgi:hypothetical protein
MKKYQHKFCRGVELVFSNSVMKLELPGISVPGNSKIYYEVSGLFF